MNGIVISFLGRDGSGKTSLINRVSGILSDSAKNPVLRYHLFTNTLLPERTGEDITKPHAKKARGPVRSFLKLFLFSLEYSAGYYFKVLPAKRKEKVIIFDRYYYDVIADPTRYKHSLSGWWAKLFLKIVPDPDLTFIIDTPSEEILRRKNELSLEQLEDLRKCYLDLQSIVPHCHIISNVGNIDDTVGDIIKVIMDKQSSSLRSTK